MFVWIILNDGSSDNTEKVTNFLLEDEKLPILCVYKKWRKTFCF